MKCSRCGKEEYIRPVFHVTEKEYEEFKASVKCMACEDEVDKGG